VNIKEIGTDGMELPTIEPVQGQPIAETVVLYQNNWTVDADMVLQPPKPGVCQECALAHDPKYPHNLNSLYYQMKFRQKNGRIPTWHDAMAHCSDGMKVVWRAELARHGIDLEEPATDEK